MQGRQVEKACWWEVVGEAKERGGWGSMEGGVAGWGGSRVLLRNC